ncbi:hypothetical protein MBLNU459_g7183t1 [Dothideomycetes sp. NU459]
MKLRSSRLTRLDAFATPSPYLASRRHIHSSKSDQASLAASSGRTSSPPSAVPYTPTSVCQAPALSCLPLSQVLRTYFITSVSSSPLLLQTCFNILSGMLNSKSALMSVERNPVLKLMLRETFYKQFCGGENKGQVQQLQKQLQQAGYQGMILEYALEVLTDAKDSDTVKDVETWRKGLLDSVDIVKPGDFVGLKWSGMGAHALQLLKQNASPTPLMDKAMREVCDAASAKNVQLLPAAEEANTTACVDAWSLALQKDYNHGKVVVNNTYQAYLKSTPAQIAEHLATAKQEGFTLGLKLVRGAYLGSEVRNLIWPSIEATHSAYDSLMESLLRRKYSGLLQPAGSAGNGSFPDISVVLATHNAASVRKAQSIRIEQAREKEELVPLAYAQLQGMADEVSCELLQAARAGTKDHELVDAPRAFKCTAWGTMTQCLNYLLRRAAENKDAAGRTAESRAAMGAELRRRFKAIFGLA